MIRRELQSVLEEEATRYPVVTVTGPRQSGKTTLCRQTFPDLPWVSLEPLDVRAFATEDPRGFLGQYADGAILDEIQHAPGLTSYIQDIVDRDPKPGRFVLTGSQNLALMSTVSQSLAGRTAVLHLLPPSWIELQRFDRPPEDLLTTLWTGAFPRIHDRGIPADRWARDYIATYVQRDVRQVLAVGELTTFDRFVRLVAGRTAQERNLSTLAADTGVTSPTARSWLSVLETGFLVHALPAFHANVRKRLVKAPKLHGVDSGLLCALLGIRTPDELALHPLRGFIFESWVASELLKQRLHQGLTASLSHYRENRGAEVDVVADWDDLLLVETKSGQTYRSEFAKGVTRLAERLRGSQGHRRVRPVVVFGGDEGQRRSDVEVLSWREIGELGAGA